MFFSVAADQPEDYNSGDIIKFHHTFSNVNPGFSGWNPDTNIFTCPSSGYYMFTVTLYKSDGSAYNYNYFAALTMSDAGEVAWMDNYRDDDVGGSVHYSSSMSAIVLCNQGEDVWVKMRSNDVRLYDSFGRYNQFSGLLIREGLE